MELQAGSGDGTAVTQTRFRPDCLATYNPASKLESSTEKPINSATSKYATPGTFEGEKLTLTGENHDIRRRAGRDRSDP